MKRENISNIGLNSGNEELQRASLIIGHLMMLILVFFSIRYYQERLLLIDASYYTFNILNTESFFIAHHRYINYLNQWLPIILMKMGFGLKGVMIGYSLSFVLFYYLIYWIVSHLWKNPIVGLFMIVALLVACRFKHYMAVTETTSTLALSFLFIGWVTRDKYLQFTDARKELGIAFALILPLLVGHAIVFLPLLSFGAFYIAYYRLFRQPYAWLTFGTIFLGLFLRYLIIPSVGYEVDKLDAFEKAPEILSTFFDQGSYHTLKKYMMSHFKWGYYLYLISLIGLLYMKRYMAVLVSLITICCYVVVIVIVYYQGESINMRESYYLFIGYFWAFTTMMVYADLKVPAFWIKILPIILVLLLSYRTLFKYGSFFTDRLEYLHSLSQTSSDLELSKSLYPSDRADHYQVLVPWSIPFTTAIYSSLKDKSDARSIYLYRQHELETLEAKNGRNVFFGAPFDKFGEFTPDNMPKEYIDLDSEPYTIIR